MATDQLVLGNIVFDDWSTPERMPFGGTQQLAVHRLPGGARVVDTLGPDEEDIHFTGVMYANNAYGVADALDGLRISGAAVDLTFAGRFYSVIVRECQVDIRRFPQMMNYHVSCLVVSNNMAGVLGTIATSVSSLVSADMATMMSLAGF
jgi:hypothetical protein